MPQALDLLPAIGYALAVAILAVTFAAGIVANVWRLDPPDDMGHV